MMNLTIFLKSYWCRDISGNEFPRPWLVFFCLAGCRAVRSETCPAGVLPDRLCHFAGSLAYSPFCIRITLCLFLMSGARRVILNFFTGSPVRMAGFLACYERLRHSHMNSLMPDRPAQSVTQRCPGPVKKVRCRPVLRCRRNTNRPSSAVVRKRA